MLVQEPVQAAIWHCLNQYAYNDAIFLAERLRAEVESEETIWLLATCYYRSGKLAQAYSLLKNSNSPQCKYLLAKCCIDLQRVAEAESVIMGGELGRNRNLEEVATEYGDLGSFALTLIATVCFQTERHQRGVESSRKALMLNPFLWTVFETLCKKGDRPDPGKTFNLSSLESMTTVTGSNPVINYVNSQVTFELSTTPVHHNNASQNNIHHDSNNSVNISTPVQIVNMGNTCMSGIRAFTPEISPLPLPLPIVARPKRAIRYRNIFPGTLSPLTPSFGVIPLDLSSSGNDSFPSPMNTLSEVNEQKVVTKRQLMRKDTPLQQSKPVFHQSGNNTPGGAPPPQTNIHVQPSVRRSSRLFSNSYAVKENTKSPNGNKFATPKSPLRKTKCRLAKHTLLKLNNCSDLDDRTLLGIETIIETPMLPGAGKRENKNSIEQENTKSPNRNKITTPKSPSRKTKCRLAKQALSRSNNCTELNDRNRGVETIIETPVIPGAGKKENKSATEQAMLLQSHSLDGLLLLMRELGQGYLYLLQFDCKKAIDVFNSLPPHHNNTGWVLAMLGKAYFEMNDYKKACSLFSEVRKIEPERCMHMEIFSTALWHLQREAALSALAQDLVALDKHSPEAWCAAGNCYSLQKEHDVAIKFFQRAVQVDPNFAYAYTLLGHEYVVTEELDKGMSCFRNAVRLDARHYNAWYGIGTIYSKQEKFLLAELHYKRALSINPNSCVLMCHIGVVQMALQRKDEALETLNKAIQLEPNNPLCKFHRASILASSNRHQDALTELEQLKELVPKESLVYYLTGKVHKKLGNTHLALMHFSWATDLDPKGATTQIKDAIDPGISHTNDMGDDSTAEDLLQRTPSQDTPEVVPENDDSF